MFWGMRRIFIKCTADHYPYGVGSIFTKKRVWKFKLILLLCKSSLINKSIKRVQVCLPFSTFLLDCHFYQIIKSNNDFNMLIDHETFVIDEGWGLSIKCCRNMCFNYKINLFLVSIDDNDEKLSFCSIKIEYLERICNIYIKQYFAVLGFRWSKRNNFITFFINLLIRNDGIIDPTPGKFFKISKFYLIYDFTSILRIYSPPSPSRIQKFISRKIASSSRTSLPLLHIHNSHITSQDAHRES